MLPNYANRINVREGKGKSVEMVEMITQKRLA